MRRFLFLSFVLYLLIVPASAQQPNAPIGSTMPVGQPAVLQEPPGPNTDLAPADRATDVTITPTMAFCTRPCQRLLLTDAKKTELNARRVANTAEWQANKAYADLVPADSPGLNQTTLGGALGTGGTGTTFTVADGSAFPTDATQYRIDLELITATRSGNTLTVVSRGDQFGAGVSLGAQTHASGAEIWQHMALGDWGSYFGPITAIMEHAGQSGYEQRARMALGQLLLAYASIPDGRYNGNTIRWPWWAIPITYDWVHEHLSANEIGVLRSGNEGHGISARSHKHGAGNVSAQGAAGRIPNRFSTECVWWAEDISPEMALGVAESDIVKATVRHADKE